MVIFHCYVSSPEAKLMHKKLQELYGLLKYSEKLYSFFRKLYKL